MKKLIKYIKLIILFVVLTFLFILIPNVSNLKNIFNEKGEYIDFVIAEKPTLFVFYQENNISIDKSYIKLLSDIGKTHGNNISIDLLNSLEDRTEMMTSIFNVSKYPSLVLINKDGFICFNYQGSFNSAAVLDDIDIVLKN